MPEVQKFTLLISLRGWGDKEVIFQGTQDEAKELAKVLGAVLREGVHAEIRCHLPEEKP